MRIALVDPASFTVPYDHHLAAALAARGAEVVLVTSRFRFGEIYAPAGYVRDERFYRLSGRIPGRSRLRLPLKAAEHAVDVVRLRTVRADVLHAQWAPLPQLDVRLLPLSRPSVITAHDVLPRRTAHRPDLWRRVYGRFDRVVVHSEHGRQRLIAEVGVPGERIVVIPHPVFPAPVRREDDGRTVLFLGVLQPYKQLAHAVEATRACGARLLVVGDPAMDVSPWRDEPHVEWRLGYRTNEEVDQALAESTLAVFPYRQELDQSGALLRAVGAGVPAVAYDVGGIAEPVRAFGAGAVVEPEDRAGLAEALTGLLGDAAALAAARAGAERCRDELSWDVAAERHLALYEAIVAERRR